MSENDYRICRACQQEKPFDSFYKRQNGDPYTTCIPCHRAYQKNRKQHPRHVAVNLSEQLVITQLKKHHIPAVPGKTLGYSWADVAAWGCVLIECKYSSDHGGVFQWNFSPVQQKQGLRAHIVVLCADYGDEITYHVFSSDDPIFTHPNGKRKTGVCYILNPKHRKRISGITPDVLEQHRDDWQLVERYRQYVATHQLDGDLFAHTWRVK